MKWLMLSRFSALCLATGAGLGPKKSPIVPSSLFYGAWPCSCSKSQYCRHSAGLALLSASDLLAQAGIAGFRLRLTLSIRMISTRWLHHKNTTISHSKFPRHSLRKITTDSHRKFTTITRQCWLLEIQRTL